MPPSLRKPAVIAALLLASVMLSIETADQGAPRTAAPASEHKSITVPPLPQTAPPAEPGPFAFSDVQRLASERCRQGVPRAAAELAGIARQPDL
jgi:hypothetical protein